MVWQIGILCSDFLKTILRAFVCIIGNIMKNKYCCITHVAMHNPKVDWTYSISSLYFLYMKLLLASSGDSGMTFHIVATKNAIDEDIMCLLPFEKCQGS